MTAPSSRSAAPPASMPIDAWGYALAIGGAVFFSTKGVFIKLAYQTGVGVETVLALRMLVAVPIYLAILVWVLAREPEMREKLTPLRILAAAAVGSLGYYVASFLDFAGLLFVSAQYERLVLFTYPFFTFALGLMFFGDRMNWRLIPAMVLSWIGLLVIFGWNLVNQADGLLIGTILVLASAITFALYQHLARRSMDLVGTRLFTCIGMSTAGLFAITHNIVQHGPSGFAGLSGEVWAYGLALGIIGTILPSFMLNHAISRIGARATSATGNFGPVMTVIMAVLILGEPFTLAHGVGTALVVIGGFWFGIQNRKG